ncbi:MAG: alpha/beta hydrolase [Actinomycetota bacterium]
MTLPDFASDDRLDPRVRRVLGILSSAAPAKDLPDRDAAIAAANSDKAVAARAMVAEATNRMNREEVASFAGISTETLTFTSTPDGNTINVCMIRPEGDHVVPCVAYLHGGGMMHQSAYDGNYQAWGRLIAAEGVAVALIDFRNCLTASSAPEVEPFPAGLNDCMSGVRWLSANASDLAIDPSRIVVAGESGGGNLTLAVGLRLVADGQADLVTGLYAFCPYIAGEYPQPDLPSTVELEGYFLRLQSNVGRLAYGIEAWEARNPQAWPYYASADDLAGMPRTVISVNECDPLRDEGIGMYRKLMAAGVPARCRTVMGTMHAVEVIPNVCPEISRDAARDLAAFAAG